MRIAAAVLLLAAQPLLAEGKPAERQPAAYDQGEKASDAQDRMICKRFARVGSLLASHRECHSKREWENMRADLRWDARGGTCYTPTGFC